MKYVTEALFQEAVASRRWLHAHPELGFDLAETVAFVQKKLGEIGIPWTDRFCPASVCGFVGDQSGKKPILALRADMDALPVQEATDLPYASQNPGKMHACGHDSHTAVLLAVARLLKQHENELPCGVRLMFQPAEESEDSGSQIMAGNGILDGVTAVLGLHSENTLPTGTLGIREGAYMAACIPLDIIFHGRSAHAALPAGGIDAIAMGVKAFEAMKKAVAEEAGDAPYIWSVGCFSGGTAHNIIAARCDMKITFRYFDQGFADRAVARVESLCKAIAEETGGRAEVNWVLSAPPVINDASVVARFRRVVNGLGLPLTELPARMSSEDFSWFQAKKPGAIFRFGTRNEALGCTTLAHRADFRIDEEGMRTAIEAFTAFVLEYSTEDSTTR